MKTFFAIYLHQSATQNFNRSVSQPLRGLPVDWAIVISTHWPSWTVSGEPAGAAMAHWTVYMGKTNAVLVKAEGSAGSLSSVSPPQHGVEDDHSTYRTSLVLSSRTKIKDTDYHSPHRTKVETPLVAHSLVFHQPEVCERSKTSEKKLDVRRLISGDWFVSPKNVNPPSASYTNAVVAESWRTRSMSETVLIWSR